MKSRATGWVGIALGLLPVAVAGGADEPLGPAEPAAAAAAPEGQPESPDSVPPLPAGPLAADGVSAAEVTVPLIFPVVGRNSWSDTFLAGRDGGKRRHHGQDIIAERLTPLVAAFDGVVWFRRKSEPNASNTLTLRGESGWSALYVHINNDRPGTDDGLGSPDYAFPAWLEPGDRVVAGQLIGWVGDSGNAEGTVPHCHFELHHRGGAVVNAAPSLKNAQRLSAPRLPAKALGLLPEAGEVGLEGVVREVDPARQVVVLQLQARTSPAGRVAVARPQRGYATCASALISPAGQPAERLALTDLTPGTAVALVGKDNKTSVAARLVWVDRPPSIPERIENLLEEAIEAIVR